MATWTSRYRRRECSRASTTVAIPAKGFLVHGSLFRGVTLRPREGGELQSDAGSVENDSPRLLEERSRLCELSLLAEQATEADEGAALPARRADEEVAVAGRGEARLLVEPAREHVVVVDHADPVLQALPQNGGPRLLAPHEVLDRPQHGILANVAGFENLFDAIVVERRDRAGTMECRLAGWTTALEVPLIDADVGTRVRIAIRAGDIDVIYCYGFGFQADLITRLLDEGATYVEVAVTGFHLTKERGGSAVNLRNFLSTGHTLLEILIRRIRRVVYQS